LPTDAAAPHGIAGTAPMDEAKAPLPLAGLRVVEFTHMVMGPAA
jgi:hypothetical protein